MCRITHARNEQEVFTDPFMFAEITLRWLNNSLDSEVVIAAIAASQEGDFFLQIILDPETLNQRLITGIILPDTLSVDLDCKGVAELRAFDGLKTLENHSTHIATDEIAVNIYRMLQKLPNFKQFYPTTGQSIFWNEQYEVIGATNEVFIDCSFQRTFSNDYEYLQAVLTDLQMFIVHTKGYWYIIGLINWSIGSIVGTWYKEQTYAALSTATITYTSIDSDIEEGGLRRFTRPYKDVVLEYSPNGDGDAITAAGSYGTPVTSVTLTPYSDLIDGKLASDAIVTLDFYAELTKTSTSNTHLHRFLLTVQYGTKYYNGATKAWQSTTTLAQSDYTTGDTDALQGVYGNLVLPLGKAGVTDGTLTISMEFKIVASPSNIMSAASFSGRLILDETPAVIHQTGTATPAFKGDFYFNDGYLIRVNGMFSNDLSDFVDANWKKGLATHRYLHELRADQLKTLLATPGTIYEVFATNFDGPVAFYELLDVIGLPIICSHDLIKQEASVTALTFEV
jgi:hypothetical protein